MTKGLIPGIKRTLIAGVLTLCIVLTVSSSLLMASLDSRFKAYDQAVSATNGVLDKAKFTELEQKFYDEAFDADGVIKEGYAKFASEEIALNADNELEHPLRMLWISSRS